MSVSLLGEDGKVGVLYSFTFILLPLCALFAEKEPWLQEWSDIVSAVYKELGEDTR